MNPLFSRSLISFHVSFLILCLKIITNPVLLVSAVGNERDRLALLAIKAQITEDPLGVTSSWNESLHLCQWKGVSCSLKHQRVTELNLSSWRLTGYVPPSIGNLSFLRILDLYNNSFHGEVPPEIGRLFRLQELVFANNSLGGEIPPSLSNCSNMRILDFSGNNFTGKIPFQLGLLPKLVKLYFDENILKGSIPPHLGNISSLQSLDLTINKLEGGIPDSLGQLRYLTFLYIGGNMISGIIPQSIFNLSSLEIFSFPSNELSGSLPRDVGFTLPRLRVFHAWENKLSGSIPISFSNASSLFILDLSMNQLSGGVPSIFGNLKNLKWLSMFSNDLGSGKASDLNFFTSLTNCSNLRRFYITDNNFGGALPSSIGNLSAQLEHLSIARNQISGTIPPGIGNLVSLSRLYMYYNKLGGTIPTTIGKLYNLEEMRLGENKLSGQIPSSIGNLTLLNQLWLEENNFRGSIPSSLGKCQKLRLLHIYGNSLNGTIPRDVLTLSSLSVSLRLSRNRFTGSLPREVGNLKNLVELDISQNELSGKIPSSLGDCTTLGRLYLDHNTFTGHIPTSLGSLRGIEEIDLSYNNLSGNIPKDFSKLVFLSKLNLSFNDLEGELPAQGVFSNVTAISIVGNDKLCGGVPELKLAVCSNKPKKLNLSRLGKLIISIVFGLLGVCLVLSFIILCCLRKDRNISSEASRKDSLPSISYREIVKATNEFSLENLIGTGGFGSVYKGILQPHQMAMAIKVFNLEKRGASKSFIAECETLKNIRHRNLVKIITACSSIDYQGKDFKALVYELVSNGSLESWLHPERQTGNQGEKKLLTFNQRLNVVIDVATALDYLHNHTETPVIHCDLKPSNILLDEDMTAYVGDFGLSRILAVDDDQIPQTITSSVGIKGTIGYAAPEYGMGSKVSTEGDVFSFGILLLEMFTGKRPTDDEFDEKMNLNQFVKMALPERVMEIVDHGLMTEGVQEEPTSSSTTSRQTRRGNIQLQCLILMFIIGVKCSEESPSERMEIKDALKELLAIKNMLLKDGRQRN